MKPKRPIDPSAPRPKQAVSDEVVYRLLAIVRGQFCGDLDAAGWGQHSHFIKRNVVLWPASFITGKGFTLPLERYEAIMKGIFAEIKLHGQTGSVRYWPGYLMKCVQDHWKHHWEDYYGEAKSARSIAETMLVNSGRAAQDDRGVEALAAAHRVLVGSRRKSKIAKPAKQPDLFPL